MREKKIQFSCPGIVSNKLHSTGLYDPGREHDACGVGFVVNIDGSCSHKIIEHGLEVIKNLLHRGATGGDAKTGDGAGILIQIPDQFFRKECFSLKIHLSENEPYGVGMVFLPHEERPQRRCKEIIESVTKEEGLSFLGWREVPVDDTCLGDAAKNSQPVIMQFFVSASGQSLTDLERKLYVLRKQIEINVQRTTFLDDRFYILSLSARTIVYKGMFMALQVAEFYKDLLDHELKSALAIVHQRYSTNTFPSWKLAQPFRYLAHNGEINTLRGNKNHMSGREKLLQSDLFGGDIKKILPIIDESGSDSACLDNALELLSSGGRTLAHSMMMLMPQAWGIKYPIGPDLRGFFEYHAGLMEPWDGPAAVAFTDGTTIGACLDRNGLRPCRYTITKDGFMVLASETGVLEFDPKDIKEKGALRPGEIILVDLDKKRVLKNTEVKTYYSRKQPYRRWVEENKISLHGFFNDVAPVSPDMENLVFRQKLFGYTREDLRVIIGQMACRGYEPVASMGTDTPLAVFSKKPQLLYSYFKQLFAQITNPAIDPIREELVMSLMTFIGNEGNILSETPQNSRLLKLQNPIISNEDLETISNLKLNDFWSTTLLMGFPARSSTEKLQESLDQLCRTAEAALDNGCPIIILSDRDLPENLAPIPALLATSAVNNYLIRKDKRTSAGIIVETGEAREVQHISLLLGFGASAVNPYLAFETAADLSSKKVLDVDVSITKAIENYIGALCNGLLKVMSKMGISTLRSYKGAQVFEAIGLSCDVIEKYFPQTASRIEGIGLAEIAAEANARYESAYKNKHCSSPTELESGGDYLYRHDGEKHLWNPQTISKIQIATRTSDYNVYKEYAKLINDQEKNIFTLRGMFSFKQTEHVPINEVEPIENIVKRFVTSAMSFGSISREAHETLAIAMNRIGAKSNSGEGGEDPDRYIPLANGENRSSAIKQVASGRFGVTATYLSNCKEIQIKIAQGAKPGEGGQLPGHKVTAEIAKVRHSTQGVTLISPPPHHDIYSIEDIKQLIFDLRNANPKARISVKLVSEVGVGTIAAGVAKAQADMVLISGYDGGTGASPLSSLRHAGAPWELGLAETQQTLVLNNLRDKIRIQVDGQMKTGRDVIIAALLGAEEFGFATAPLVVCGCIMMRKCHLNTCPVGIATQDPLLRQMYTGKPEHVINFFNMIAEDVREHMALLGFRNMDELIGRCDLLEMNKAIDFWKANGLDFSKILMRPADNKNIVVRCIKKHDYKLDKVLDVKLIKLAKEALDNKKPVYIEEPIRNVNLTTGAMLSGRIAKLYGEKGLPDNTINCVFKGAAGQSFGAFCTRGITMTLVGEANDYLGKGLCGAKIIVRPPEEIGYEPSENIICGNVLLYGATSGEVYIYGRGGERFAIRNSGACAVIEGVGDHGCEYMTGGRIVVLGETGVNFAAGMSGGIAYVFDPTSELDARCNLAMVDLEIVSDPNDKEELKEMINSHLKYTGSNKAKYILDNWEMCLPLFVKVFPMEYRRVLGQMIKEDVATEREEIVSR